MSELLSDVGKKILREHVDRQNEPLNEAKVVDKFDIEDTEKQQFSYETLKELGITTSKNKEVFGKDYLISERGYELLEKYLKPQNKKLLTAEKEYQEWLRRQRLFEQKRDEYINYLINENPIRGSQKTALQQAIEAGISVPDVAAKAVTDIDIAKAYIDTIITARPVANFFGGDIMEPVFDWLYYTADWNVNMYGRQFADGMYSCLMIWFLMALVCYFVLSRTQAGNWIYSTGGNLSAAKANGVPTNKVKISLFMFTAFCATMFAACQVFEVNTSDAAKGNLKELEAIAAAVIGGVVLTGGFGTVLGIILGAVIFGIAKEAFFYIPGIDGSFYRVFLGAVLVSAALTNENIRKRIIGSV